MGTAEPPVGGGDIVYWFLITTIPSGGAPEEVRRRWVGVPLPVRRPRPIEGPEPHVGRNLADRQVRLIPDGVAVTPHDAFTALRLFDRADAAAWWEAHCAAHPEVIGFVFRAWEGQLMPPSYASLRFPEIDAFDDE
ncbi:MAG TPA: hypothetical protein VGI06_17395 [Acidimicrobiales bacterium]